jgi:glycosyltransferase involved in cell wall biosynthesis
MKKSAHFLHIPELAYSPPNDAIVTALLELGYQVDLFAPVEKFSVDYYGPRVTANYAEYSKRWILKNAFSQKWFKYDLFSGTTEDPMSIVGLLSKLYHRPSFTLADEIKSGSYSGNRSKKWKNYCQWGMRQSKFTIVNDKARIPIQHEYAKLSDNHPIIVYPGCFKNPPEPADRSNIRSKKSIPFDSIVLAYSGVFYQGNGGLWLAEILEKRNDVYIWGQFVGLDPLVQELLKKIKGSERLYIEPERLSWRECWSSMSAVDIGMVVYLQDGPQFQNMGTSSNRLCMFLAMGVPVIASRQPSFEFIERYDCGVLVSNEKELLDAIDYIGQRLDTMKSNALICAREYIDAPGKYKILAEMLSKFS